MLSNPMDRRSVSAIYVNLKLDPEKNYTFLRWWWWFLQNLFPNYDITQKNHINPEIILHYPYNFFPPRCIKSKKEVALRYFFITFFTVR